MDIREFEFLGPVVAVHAHPDDETLTSGALLAQCVAREVPVTLVTCTRGEQGEVIGPDPLALEGNGSALGEYREGELARAMSALGVVDHLFLDEVPVSSDDSVGIQGLPTVRYVDSGMSWVNGDLGDGASSAAQLPEEVAPHAFYFSDLDVAVGRLVRVLEDRQAQSVVTYEPGGGYGHPDHVRAYEVARRAVDVVNSFGTRTVRLLSAIIPPDVAQTSRARLLELSSSFSFDAVLAGGVLPKVADPYPSVSNHAPSIVFTVPMSEVADKVLEAMKAHATQIQWAQIMDHDDPDLDELVQGVYALSNNIVAPILGYEYYAEI